MPTNNAEQPTPAVAVSTKPNICFITHHEASDPFWDVIGRGASDAADVAEVDITYRSGPNGDDQARLIDECVAERPYGIVVSTPDLEAVEDSIDAAVEANIPIVTINGAVLDADGERRLGHVGASQELFHEALGQRLTQDGFDGKLVYFLHEESSSGYRAGLDELRLQYVGDSIPIQLPHGWGASDDEDKENLQAIKDLLESDPEIEVLVARHPLIALLAAEAVNETASAAKIAVISYSADNEELFTALETGDILYALDQQPYVQGYMPIVKIQLYRTNRLTFGGRNIHSGPAFISSENVRDVRELHEQGSR